MLNETFSALSDPTRREILGVLTDGEQSVNELVARFHLTQSAISRHLQMLERAGLIDRRRDGQRRMCILRAEPLAAASDWLDRYRGFWKGALDRLAIEVERPADGE